MPQYLPFNETSKIKIFDNQVTGDFTAVTVGTDLFSLGMDRAIENYTLTNFSVRITNEASVTADGPLTLNLQSSSDGVTFSAVSSITFMTQSNGAIMSNTLATAITVGQYIRIQPTTFTSVQPSFHILVEGERTV